MTLWEAEPLARAGVAVRHESWPVLKYFVFKAGGGTTSAVGIVSENGIDRVMRAADFTLTETTGDGWQIYA